MSFNSVVAYQALRLHHSVIGSSADTKAHVAALALYVTKVVD